MGCKITYLTTELFHPQSTQITKKCGCDVLDNLTIRLSPTKYSWIEVYLNHHIVCKKYLQEGKLLCKQMTWCASVPALDIL